MNRAVDFRSVELCLIDLGVADEAREAILRLIRLHARQGPVLLRSGDPPKTLGDIAADFLRSSLRRKELIGRAADDPSWNMLLALFSDQQRGSATSVSSACYASGAAPTTALRHLDNLWRQGLILRRPDLADGRRTYLELSGLAVDRLAALIESFCVEPPGVARESDQS